MSRTRNGPEDRANDPGGAYLQLSRMLREGRSWSGRERNCCFLNTRDGRFADVSASSGFDFPDDARAVALCDWDRDGDQDLWVSNRNAPRLRFLRNEAPRENRFLSIGLVGNGRATNRDAIGARVEVHPTGAGARPLSRTLRAGEGFLAQSSKWLHFGLAQASGIEKVVVRWPAGEPEEFRGLELDRRYRLVQGSSGAAAPAALDAGKEAALEPSEPSLPAESATARVPLVTLLRVPRPLYQRFDGSTCPLEAGSGRPLLVNLWATWCAPCVAELRRFAGEWASIRAAGLDVVALSVDGLGDRPSDPSRAPSLLQELKLPFPGGRATRDLVNLLQHLHDASVPLHRPLPVPSSFLIDASGRLSVIYKGPVAVDVLLGDLGHSARSRLERWSRAAPLGGRAIDDERIAYSAKLMEVEERFLFAADLAGAGRLDDAILEYQEVLELKPDFAEARSNLGLARFRKGDLDGALESFQEALAVRPDMAEAHFNLGAVLDRRGEPARAEARYREALRLKPDYPGAWSALGLACAKQGKRGEARGFFEREIALDPSSAEAHDSLGVLCLEEGQGSEAEKHFREAVRLDPDHADARNNLGIVLKRQGRLDDAAREYLHAIRVNPRFAEAHSNLGAVYLNQGRLAEAEAELARALEIQPDFAAARSNLDRVRAARGR